MKKTIIGLALLASGSVFAQVSATSSVSGFVQSLSSASGNQVSTQAANASSANYAGALATHGIAYKGLSLAHTETSGFTHAQVLGGGTGPGSSASQAVQSGQASGQNTEVTSLGNLLTQSNAVVGTASQATVGTAPGQAIGTSFAVSRNDTNAFTNENRGGGPGATGATGTTSGITIMNMAVPSSGSGAASSFGTLGSGFGAVQQGSFSATMHSP